MIRRNESQRADAFLSSGRSMRIAVGTSPATVTRSRSIVAIAAAGSNWSRITSVPPRPSALKSRDTPAR